LQKAAEKHKMKYAMLNNHVLVLFHGFLQYIEQREALPHAQLRC